MNTKNMTQFYLLWATAGLTLGSGVVFGGWAMSKLLSRINSEVKK